MNNLPDWLDWIHAQHHTSIDLGLERIARVYEQLDAPRLARMVITVAGTNGKGSTIALLSSLLRSAGKQVGVYTSPHILRFNERIAINGDCIEDQALIDAFQTVHDALGDDRLSFFEFTTLSAFVYFSQHELDVVLLEVGLGGRLDAVNVMDPDVAIITSIALDHQDWLGDDVRSIAFEKSGILRPDIPFICGDTEVNDYLTSRGHELRCLNYIYGSDFVVESVDDELHWSSFENGDVSRNVRLTSAQLPLNSVAIALKTIELVCPDMSWRSIPQVIAQTQLTGRYQKMTSKHGVMTVFDVAHNPASVALLHERLTSEGLSGDVVAVFAALADKDTGSMVECVSGVVDRWHVSCIRNNERSESKEKLSQLLSQRNENVTMHADLLSAYQTAYDSVKPGDCLLVFGSFYALAELFEQESDLNLMKGVA